MDATAFDGISRELGQGATRRRCFRLIGGVAAGGAAVALGLGETVGKKKRKRRRQGHIFDTSPWSWGNPPCNTDADCLQLTSNASVRCVLASPEDGGFAQYSGECVLP